MNIARPVPNFHRALQIHYSFKFTNLVLGFAFQILVVKTLSPNDYATYAFFLALLLTMERVFSLGIDRTLLRYVPAYSADGNFASLRILLRKAAIARVASIAVAVSLVYLMAVYGGGGVLPDESPLALYSFCIWYIGYAVMTDLEMLAQSWVLHATTAVAGTLDVLARSASVLCLVVLEYKISGVTIIVISAITTSLASVFVLARMVWLRSQISHLVIERDKEPSHPAVRGAPVFALSVYASNLGWLMTSPSVIRILAKGGLDVVAFSAFSFAQALCVSIQRSFPGPMVLPSLEPIFARFATSPNLMSELVAMIFKFELICFASFSIVTVLAGEQLIAIISRPEYGQYYYLFPAIMFVLLLQTIYRVGELVASLQLTHVVFLFLWPVSILGTASLYFTVEKWGVVAILLIPVLESLVRIAIVMHYNRHSVGWRAIDPVRSLQVCLSASVVIVIALLVRKAFPEFQIALAMGSLLVFFGSLFVARPFRKEELQCLALAVPSSPRALTRSIARLAR